MKKCFDLEGVFDFWNVVSIYENFICENYSPLKRYYFEAKNDEEQITFAIELIEN